MLRRTFLTLLGAVAWPWRKAKALPKSTEAVELIYMQNGKRVVVRCELENPGGHPIKFIPVRNVSGHRIEAGTCVKLVDDDNGVIPV